MIAGRTSNTCTSARADTQKVSKTDGGINSGCTLLATKLQRSYYWSTLFRFRFFSCSILLLVFGLLQCTDGLRCIVRAKPTQNGRYRFYVAQFCSARNSVALCMQYAYIFMGTISSEHCNHHLYVQWSTHIDGSTTWFNSYKAISASTEYDSFAIFYIIVCTLLFSHT